MYTGRALVGEVHNNKNINIPFYCPSKVLGWPLIIGGFSSQMVWNVENVSIVFFLAATKQLQEHFCSSVRLSVRSSVCRTFSLCSCHRIIMKFFGAITMDTSGVHAKGSGQKSKVKVTEVKANFAPSWPFADHNSSLSSQMATKWYT